MKVAIDISHVQSGHTLRGSGTYIRELIPALQKYGKQHVYAVIKSGQSVPSDADIVHYPYFDPFVLTLPLIKSKPTIVTVHDLIPLVFPDKFPKGIRGSLLWQTQKLSLGGCSRIITDSQSSKHDIGRIIGYDPNKIDIVPLAPSEIFRPGKKYRLPSKYVLYVGDVNWNKNIKALLEAYALFAHKYQKNIPVLVLAGGAFLNTTIPEVQEINKLIQVLNIQTLVVKPGFVPDEELAGMYGNALCTVQPSHYEGFGFPVLEAMACGSPVICSNVSSLTEIAGPAFTTEPDDIEGIANMIHGINTMSSVKRAALIKKGLAWAGRFTWKKVAESNVLAYEKVINYHSGL